MILHYPLFNFFSIFQLLKKNEVDHPEEKWETETNTFFELASMFMEVGTWHELLSILAAL